MMIRFRGRTNQSHRIKNKPIKEGYNLFGLAFSLTGFVLNFTPCGANTETRTETSNEYEDKENGKILSVILFLVNLLEAPTAAGRKFVVTLDNFFTLPNRNNNLASLI